DVRTGTGELVRSGGGLPGFVVLAYVAVTVLVAVDQRWRARDLLLGLGSAIIPYLTVPFERSAHRRGLLGESWRLREETGRTAPERVVSLALRRPLPAALVTLVVLVIVFSLLLMAGPPTQWFSCAAELSAATPPRLVDSSGAVPPLRLRRVQVLHAAGPPPPAAARRGPGTGRIAAGSVPRTRHPVGAAAARPRGRVPRPRQDGRRRHRRGPGADAARSGRRHRPVRLPPVPRRGRGGARGGEGPDPPRPGPALRRRPTPRGDQERAGHRVTGRAASAAPGAAQRAGAGPPPRAPAAAARGAPLAHRGEREHPPRAHHRRRGRAGDPPRGRRHDPGAHRGRHPVRPPAVLPPDQHRRRRPAVPAGGGLGP